MTNIKEIKPLMGGKGRDKRLKKQLATREELIEAMVAEPVKAKKPKKKPKTK